MDRSEYFSSLRDTSEVVRPILRHALRPSPEMDQDLRAAINLLVEPRLADGTLLLKPHLVRLAYEASGGDDWSRIAPICAAAEVLNISSYQSNLSFDGKFRVLSARDRLEQYIASVLSRECITQLVKQATNKISTVLLKTIEESFSNANRAIYLGQSMDLNVLQYSNRERYSNFDSYMIDYRIRCRLLSGTFTGETAKVGAIAAGASAEVQKVLYDFGELYGTGLQMVNDLGDYIRSSTVKLNSLRQPCDQFGDLRLGKLTLPLFLLLMDPNAMQFKHFSEYIGRETLDSEEEQTIEWALSSFGIVDISRRNTKSIMRAAKKSLHCLPDSSARSMLSIMISQLKTNKFHHVLARNLNAAN